MLHGWTGDVDSMWVFANRLPADAWLVALQAPFSSARGGYSWRDESLRPAPPVETLTSNYPIRQLPSFEELRPAAESVLSILTHDHFPGGETTDNNLLVFDVVGFSQGGALAFALALMQPARVRKLVGLSTFVPPGADVLALRTPLVNHPVLIAHGSQDTIVPPAIARQAAALLEQAGAEVAYCESDVGHKLGSDCFFALEKFMQ
jgi:phospholipase/carboxylesterase